VRAPAILREEPQFRLLFAGQALSVVGDRLAPVALAFAVLDDLNGTAGELGAVVAAGTVPFAFFALLAGVWADRLPRQKVMLASDLVRFAVQLTAGILLLTRAAEVWHLAALAAVYGTADAFFQPALSGLMPQVVPAHRLQQANALRGLTMSTGLAIGPAVAGVLVAVAGPGEAILADAATFAVSAACLAGLRPRMVARSVAETGSTGFFNELRGGWAEVCSRTWVWSVLLAMGAYHLVVLPSIFVLGPVLANEELDGASSWAIILTAFGAGAIAGDLLIFRLRPRRPMFFAVVCLVIASCQAAIIGSGLPTAGIAALEAVTGVAVTSFFTLWETSLQERIPERAISRVSSFDFFATAGLMPIGLALAGPIAAGVGLHETLYAMTAVGVALSVACLCVPEVRRLERYGATSSAL
jgi:MFS family permease